MRRRSSALAALVLAALAVPQPAGAATASLEIAPVDGGPRTLVATNPDPSNGYGRPAWSPDGTRLTVATDAEDVREESAQRRLLQLPAASSPPATAIPLARGYEASVSPDGATVAELTDSGLASGRGGFVFRDVASGAVRATVPQWAEGDDLYENEPGVCWSADGRRAAVAAAQRRAGTAAVHVLDLPTGRTLVRRPARLGEPAGPQCFTADGSRLLLVDEQRLVAVDPATGGARAIPTWGRYFEEAAWSPDGSRIALTGPGELAMVDPQTGWGLSHATGGRNLLWSPDGQRLAFVAGGFDETTSVQTPETLTVVDAARPDAPSTLVRPRGAELGPFSWSPDGARIAFTAWRSR